MARFAVGERVRHERFGEGTVVARIFGRRVRVRFDSAAELPRTMRQRDLATANGAQPPPADMADAGGAVAVAETAPQPQSPTNAPEVEKRTSTAVEHASADRADLLQVLEALRLGVVPPTHVRDYTVSRDAEIHEIGRLLAEGRGARIVWGHYGTGKTHLLDAAQQLASEQGFVTSRIVLDPREVPPTHPKKLYRAVVNNLALPGDAGRGLDPLLEKLIKSSSHRGVRGPSRSRFFSPYLHALCNGDHEAIGWLRDYVHGDNMSAQDVNQVLKDIGWRGDRVLTMSDYRTYGRMYVHMLGTLASWSRDAGYGGLVLLLDEVEFVDELDAHQLEFALEVLKHLVAVTVPESDLAFSPDDLYKGGQPVHRKIPLLFEPDQPLFAIFALTPLAEIEQQMRRIMRTRRHDLELTQIGHSVVPDLVTRIANLYGAAHPSFTLAREDARKISKAIMEAVDDGEDDPRAIVRGTVFMLDAARLREVV